MIRKTPMLQLQTKFATRAKKGMSVTMVSLDNTQTEVGKKIRVKNQLQSPAQPAAVPRRSLSKHAEQAVGVIIAGLDNFQAWRRISGLIERQDLLVEARLSVMPGAGSRKSSISCKEGLTGFIGFCSFKPNPREGWNWGVWLDRTTIYPGVILMTQSIASQTAEKYQGSNIAYESTRGLGQISGNWKMGPNPTSRPLL